MSTIHSRVVSRQDEKTHAWIESVEISVEDIQLRITTPGPTESQAIVSALNAAYNVEIEHKAEERTTKGRVEDRAKRVFEPVEPQ